MDILKQIYKVFGLSSILFFSCNPLVSALTVGQKQVPVKQQNEAATSVDISQVINLIRQGNYQAANTDLDELLKTKEDSAEIHYWKASVLSHLGDAVNALKHIDLSLQLDPQNRQIKQEQASILIQAGKLAEAEKVYSSLVETAQRPSEIQQLKRLQHLVEGQREINNGNIKKALSLYQSLAQMYPREFRVYEALGYIYTELGFWKEAEDNYLKAELLAPTDANIQRRMAVMYNKKGDDENTKDRYRKAIELDPNGPDGLAAIKNLMVKGKEAVLKNQTSKAVEDYQTILDVRPDYVAAKMAMADAYMQAGQTDAAKSVYLHALESNPKNLDVKVKLAEMYFKHDEIDEAVNLYQEIVDLSTDSKVRKDAQSRLNMLYVHKAERLSRSIKNNQDKKAAYGIVKRWVESGNLDNAQWLVNGIIRQYPNDETAHYWLGLIDEGRGQLADALKSLSKSAWIDPKDMATRLAMARIMAKTGDLKQAEATYRDILDQVKDKKEKTKVEKLLGFVTGESLIRAGDLRSALKHYQNMLTKDAKDISVIKRIADVYAGLGDMKSASNSINQIKKIRENTRKEIQYLSKGRALAQKGKYDQAQQSLQQVVSLNPDNAQALYLLGAINVRLSNTKKALSYFKKSLDQASDNVTLRMEYAKLLTQVGDLPQAINQYKQALNQSSNRIQRKNINLLLGFVQGQNLLDTNNMDKALLHFQNMRIVYPKNVDVQGALASVYVRLGFFDEAIDVYKKVLDLNPDRAKTYVQMGIVEGKKHDFAAQLDYLSSAIVMDPNGQDGQLARNILLQNAESDVKQKDYEAAMAQMNAILKIKPSDTETNLLLAKVYEDQKKSKKAEEIYLRVLALNPVDLKTRKKFAEFYVKTGNLEGALVEYQKIYDMAPSSELGQAASAKLNFLYGRQAEQYSKKLDTNAARKEAVATAEKWIEKDRLDAAQWLLGAVIDEDAKLSRAQYLLGSIHYKKGELRTALGFAEKAVAQESNNPEYGLLYANLLVGIGKFDQAEKTYVKVIAFSQNDGYMRKQAEKQLGMMVGEKLSRAKNYQAALAQYRKLQAKNADDTDIMGRIAGVLVKIGNFDEAERIYLHALRIDPENAAINVALAQMYRQTGNQTAYLIQLRQAFLFDKTGGLGDKMLKELDLKEGVQQLHRHRWNAAIVAFNRALEVNPNNIFAQLGISAAYKEGGNDKLAKQALDRVINLDKVNLDTRLKFLFLKASYAME